MGVYVYTLRAPRNNINVNIDGRVESVALLAFNYKPTWNFFDGEPRWQILAKARCQRMDNIWSAKGYPKYVAHVFIHDDGTIDYLGARVSEWSIQSATISDGLTAYDRLKTVGFLKHQYHKIWELTPNPPTV